MFKHVVWSFNWYLKFRHKIPKSILSFRALCGANLEIYLSNRRFTIVKRPKIVCQTFEIYLWSKIFYRLAMSQNIPWQAKFAGIVFDIWTICHVTKHYLVENQKLLGNVFSWSEQTKLMFDQQCLWCGQTVKHFLDMQTLNVWQTMFDRLFRT